MKKVNISAELSTLKSEHFSFPDEAETRRAHRHFGELSHQCLFYIQPSNLLMMHCLEMFSYCKRTRNHPQKQ